MPFRTSGVADVPVLGSQFSDVVLASLLRRRAEDGHLSNNQVRTAARLVDKGESTLWNWIKLGAVPKNVRPHYEAKKGDIQAFFDMDGSFAAAWRVRKQADPDTPSYDTFIRALKTALKPADIGEAKEGPRGADKYMLSIPVKYESKNSVLHVDAMQFDVPTKAKGWKKVRYPWVVCAYWGKVRAVGGFSVTFLEPTQEDVMEAIYQAIVASPDSPFRGIPDAIRSDNGSQFTANAVEIAQVLLQVDAIVGEPYQPHLNGLLERFHLTLKQEFEIGKPHNKKGPKKRDGKTTEWPKGYYLDHDDFVDEFIEYIYNYNFKRKHSSLERGEQTPFEAWEAEDGPIREIDPSLARRFLTRMAEVKVTKSGIDFEGVNYWDPNLVPGRKVQIHYGNDRRSVEVYDDDGWVATAKQSADGPTIDDLAKVLELRTQDRKERSKHRSRRRRAKQIRVSSRTGPGTSRLISGMSGEEVREEIRDRLGPEAADAAEVSRVLGLDEHGNRKTND